MNVDARLDGSDRIAIDIQVRTSASRIDSLDACDHYALRDEGAIPLAGPVRRMPHTPRMPPNDEARTVLEKIWLAERARWKTSRLWEGQVQFEIARALGQCLPHGQLDGGRVFVEVGFSPRDAESTDESKPQTGMHIVDIVVTRQPMRAIPRWPGGSDNESLASAKRSRVTRVKAAVPNPAHAELTLGDEQTGFRHARRDVDRAQATFLAADVALLIELKVATGSLVSPATMLAYVMKDVKTLSDLRSRTDFTGHAVLCVLWSDPPPKLAALLGEAAHQKLVVLTDSTPAP